MSRAILKAHLKAAKLTPTVFAQLIGLSQTVAAGLVSGAEPVPSWVLRIAKLYNAAPVDLRGSIMQELIGEPCWKQMREFPIYEISNGGRIRRAVATTRKFFISEMRTRRDRNGYEVVYLTDARKKVRPAWVHREVAKAFCRKRTGHDIVCHRDGDQLNNKASNLYWGTSATNAMDRVKHAYIRVLKARGISGAKAVQKADKIPMRRFKAMNSEANFE